MMHTDLLTQSPGARVHKSRRQGTSWGAGSQAPAMQIPLAIF